MTKTGTFDAVQLSQWRSLKRELAGSRNDLVGPFPGYRPPAFDSAEIKILYVGKATSGAVSEAELAHVYSYKASPFWSFGRSLTAAISKATGKRAEFAWSNVAKLGVLNGNPDDDLLELQAPLAVSTLLAELEKLKPKLVVFVTDGFADALVYEVLGIAESEGRRQFDLETRSGELHDFYSRKEVLAIPPVLWVQHPQGKTLIARESWIKEAIELLRCR